MTLEITLYTKPGCHLCEQAIDELGLLQQHHPHVLNQIDIMSDPELMRRYAERIPVVVIGGREQGAPLSRDALERAFREAEGRRAG